MDYEVIVFSDDWFGLPFSCKHLMLQFLPDVRLVWVQTIGLRSPAWSPYDLRRVVGKLTQWAAPEKIAKSKIPENVVIIDPVQFPYNHIGLVRAVNRRIMIQTLRARAPLSPKRQRVFLTNWPFLADLLGHLGETLSIYYRVDDYSEMPGVKRDFVIRAERELIRKVDLVVATSERLMVRGDSAEKARYLPHGVDISHFSGVVPIENGDEVWSKIPHPRIGFFGLINSWVDLDLIARLADKHPEWHFALIGPSQLPAGAHPRRPNIHYLGPRSYDELPRHAAEFDVALIPFKMNALTQAVNPLKLLEYFSLGLPVVSTPLPEVLKFAEHLFLADNEDGFEKAIASALGDRGRERRAIRQTIAEGNSWQKRASDLRQWIEAALADKMARGGKNDCRRSILPVVESLGVDGRQ
jgi:glycosyltransferase involved in cell wall biosynthesis